MRSQNFLLALLHQRHLCWRLSQREVSARYRGSAIGMAWSLINPLFMLAIYTFVFSTVFKSRWGNLEDAGPLGFAINLFVGLIVFNLFAECVSKGPSLVLCRPNFVTKVVFPLEILPLVTVASACFQALSSLAILGIFELIVIGRIPSSILWLPLVWLPLISCCLAAGWILGAIGVYLRDLEQVTGVLLSALMFMSAVFYPFSALPERWQPLLALNPLAVMIEQTRRVTINGQQPDLSYLLFGSILGLGLCELSYRIFQRARLGFADVL